MLQKHLPLTNVTPDSERGQVHRQIVPFSLKETRTYDHKAESSDVITLPYRPAAQVFFTCACRVL